MSKNLKRFKYRAQNRIQNLKTFKHFCEWLDGSSKLLQSIREETIQLICSILTEKKTNITLEIFPLKCLHFFAKIRDEIIENIIKVHDFYHRRFKFDILDANS